jgi:DNA-directed RNA polymerase specialized sigma24 family protein
LAAFEINRSEVEQTVNRVFDAHYVYLVRYVYRATGSFERAEDAVQAAFLSFYRALGATGNTRPYLSFPDKPQRIDYRKVGFKSLLPCGA